MNTLYNINGEISHSKSHSDCSALTTLICTINKINANYTKSPQIFFWLIREHCSGNSSNTDVNRDQRSLLSMSLLAMAIITCCFSHHKVEASGDFKAIL